MPGGLGAGVVVFLAVVCVGHAEECVLGQFEHSEAHGQPGFAFDAELDFVAVGGEYAPDGDGVGDVLAGVGHGVSLAWLGCGHSPVRPLVAVLQGMHSGPW